MELESYIQHNFGIPFSKENSPFEYHSKTLPKNSIVSDLGIIENHAYFLKKGIVQLSVVNEDVERIIAFFFDGSFFSAFSSLIIQQPSDVIIETVTECDVEVLPFTKIREQLKDSLFINQFLLFETQKGYLKRAQREKDLLTKSPEQRYKDLLREQPEYIHQIPVKKIALYLGIHPESLSRIRSRI